MVGNSAPTENPYQLSRQTVYTDHSSDLNRNVPVSQKCDIIITGSTDETRHNVLGHTGNPNLGSPSTESDVMLELVKNKSLMKASKMDQRFSSIDSDMSEASTLLSVGSEKTGTDDKEKRRYRINHHSIRGFVSDSETESISVLCLHFLLVHGHCLACIE